MSIRVCNLYKEQIDKTAHYIFIGRASSLEHAKRNSHSSLHNGSIFGNPFRVVRETERDNCLKNYKVYFSNRRKTDQFFERCCQRLIELGQTKNVVLVCFCAPLGCHGDIIIEELFRKETP